MIKRIVLSIVVAIAVALLCLGVAYVLPASGIATFLHNYADLIGLLAGIWYFFTGRV